MFPKLFDRNNGVSQGPYVHRSTIALELHAVDGLRMMQHKFGLSNLKMLQGFFKTFSTLFCKMKSPEEVSTSKFLGTFALHKQQQGYPFVSYD